MYIYEVLYESGMCKSKKEAQRMIKQGAVKLNGIPIKDEKAVLCVDKNNNMYYTLRGASNAE